MCTLINVATNLKMVNVAQLNLVILICAVHDILVLAILANEVVFHFGLQVSLLPKYLQWFGYPGMIK